MHRSRNLFVALIVALGLSILMMFGFGAMGFPYWSERVFIIMWIFNGHLATAAVAMSAFERNRVRRLAISGILASPLAFIVWVWLIVQGDEAPAVGRWVPALATPLTALAGYAAFVASLIHMPRLDSVALWLRRVVFAFAAIASVHIALAVAIYQFRAFDGRDAMIYISTHQRWVGIYLVLIAYTTLAAAAALYLRRLFAHGRPLVEPVPVRVTCPRCDRAQEIKTEGDCCAACGLRIRIAMP